MSKRTNGAPRAKPVVPFCNTPRRFASQNETRGVIRLNTHRGFALQRTSRRSKNLFAFPHLTTNCCKCEISPNDFNHLADIHGQSPRFFAKADKRPRLLSTRAGVIAYTLSRSSRRRSILIRIDSAAQVSVIAPFYAKLDEIHRFVDEKAHWISRKLTEKKCDNDVLKQRNYENGNEFLFLGKKFRLKIQQSPVRKSRLTFDGAGWTAIVPASFSQREQQIEVKKKLVKWYRKQAEEILGGRIFFYARMIGVSPKKIAVRTQKRIWGSCDHRRKIIHLNWMLVLSPLKVVDYVVVHELCHLKVNNHSQRFWGEVQKVFPDYKEQIRWFKVNAIDMVLP